MLSQQLILKIRGQINWIHSEDLGGLLKPNLNLISYLKYSLILFYVNNCLSKEVGVKRGTKKKKDKISLMLSVTV